MPDGSRSKSRGGKAGAERIATVERGSGNVFADLGLPDPDLALAKAELVQRIRGLIEERRLTSAGAAELLGLDQPKLESLIRGGTSRYSMDRLFRFLNALGQRVEIAVRPDSRREGIRSVIVT
ncbi:hypothetical protein OJF2_45840 [Aquisphaera giovannonii]|uniref:HigA2-like helix-turn-helix domain-containing protein n=1 Tax=Aquisphaera giovannonii TaxID=406548 RepID=A0A5B9W5S7_9BACT|nr:helix-turn-helix transcriptional regulator [Aquisphaera giovannonii]QEH36026.1 hypothetical protein OJF2_45840 [Aquisphaera giovannonii]